MNKQIGKLRWVYLSDGDNKKWSLVKIIEYTNDYNNQSDIIRILSMRIDETLDMYNDGQVLLKRVR